MSLNQITHERDHLVSRFIFDRNHFAPMDNRVKPRALEPDTESRQTSVFRTSSLQDEDIWKLAAKWVEPERGKPARARADVNIDAVTRFKLRVVSSEPPPRHANIEDWPTSKDERMSVAQQLAAEALLVIRPEADDQLEPQDSGNQSV